MDLKTLRIMLPRDLFLPADKKLANQRAERIDQAVQGYTYVNLWVEDRLIIYNNSLRVFLEITWLSSYSRGEDVTAF